MGGGVFAVAGVLAAATTSATALVAVAACVAFASFACFAFCDVSAGVDSFAADGALAAFSEAAVAALAVCAFLSLAEMPASWAIVVGNAVFRIEGVAVVTPALLPAFSDEAAVEEAVAEAAAPVFDFALGASATGCAGAAAASAPVAAAALTVAVMSLASASFLLVLAWPLSLPPLLPPAVAWLGFLLLVPAFAGGDEFAAFAEVVSSPDDESFDDES